MYKKNLNVRLDEKLSELLEILKSKNDINISSLIRRILNKSLKEIIDNNRSSYIHD